MPGMPGMPGTPGMGGAWPVLIAAAVLLSLSMGLRQSLGIFMPPVTRAIGISVADFTLALAVQNLAWGVLQPLAGMLADRHGFRRIMLTGAACYVVAMLVMALAQGLWWVLLGAGVLVGVALACTGTAITLAVATRVVSPARRSLVLGVVSATGSLGAMIAAPAGQLLSQEYGWRIGLVGFMVMAVFMLPAAWLAGRADATPLPANAANSTDGHTARQALGVALRHAPFLVMSGAYFVCGMQLVFITTHLPAYLDLCGMDPMLGAQVLGVIGGMNVLGSLFFGWAGGRWNKFLLLGLIYTLRSLVLAAYFMGTPTPANTLVFAALMGFLWLGVAPLTAGAVAQMFGVRWQAMIQGLAFFSHQMGSVTGAWGGGLIFHLMGNYDMAWRFGVGLGLAAGIVQMAVGWRSPPGQARLAAA